MEFVGSAGSGETRPMADDGKCDEHDCGCCKDGNGARNIAPGGNNGKDEQYSGSSCNVVTSSREGAIPPAINDYSYTEGQGADIGLDDGATADRSQTCGYRCCSCVNDQSCRSSVAVISTFVVMFLTVGIMYSFGVFYVELLDYYGKSPSSTSMIGSINSGTCHAAATLVGFIEARIGIRRTLVVGALISAAGMAISSFVPSMFVLYITYGIFSGFGLALAYTASIGVVTAHFSCQRSLDISVGIASSGQGFGLLAMPPLVRVLTKAFGWKGAMLLCGGLVLNVCVCAAISWPPLENPTDGLPERFTRDEARSSNISKNCNIFCDISPMFSLLKNKILVIVLLSEMLSNVTLSVTLTTLPDFTRCHGHDMFKASFLLSIYGITMTLGRLYLSFFTGVTKLGSNKKVSILVAHLFSMLSVLCIGFTATSYPLLSVCTAIFGLVSGAKGTIAICYVIKLGGVKNTVLGMGVLGFSCGVGQFIGPPLAGALFFKTGWYPIVYCFGAFASLICVSLFVVIVILHRQSQTNRSTTSQTESRDMEMQREKFFRPGRLDRRLEAIGSTFSLTSLP